MVTSYIQYDHKYVKLYTEGRARMKYTINIAGCLRVMELGVIYFSVFQIEPHVNSKYVVLK